MSASSPALKTRCPRCGVPLDPVSAEGLCPRCLVAMNLSLETDMPQGEAPSESGAGAPPRPTAPSPAEIAPHFPQLEILECLGRGGMGVVYRARQPHLDRLVALKILASEKEKEAAFAERFIREAQTLARLSHQNIVTIYDFGKVDGLYYLLMEYVNGVSLRQLLQAKKITPEEALAIVPRICEALQYAHEHGVVHRDIKPENVLLNQEGLVKIADFGIAKVTADAPGRAKITQDRQVIGTAAYMAPEQLEHPQTVDRRADIYSLGVVFYEMLTGELPLGRFAVPSSKVQIDVRLDRVVLKALEKEPERRYQQVSEVKRDVEVLSHKPTQTTPAAQLKAPTRHQPLEPTPASQSKVLQSNSQLAAWSAQRLAILLILMVIAFATGALWFFGYESPRIEAAWAQTGAVLPPLSRLLVTVGRACRTTGVVALPLLLLTTMASLAWWVWLAVNRSSSNGLERELKAAGFGVVAAGLMVAVPIWAGRALAEFRFVPEGILACLGLLAPGFFVTGAHAVGTRRNQQASALKTDVETIASTSSAGEAVNRAPTNRRSWRMLCYGIALAGLCLCLVFALGSFFRHHVTGDASRISQEAWQLWQSGDIEAAKTKFNQAVKLAPGAVEPWNGLGWSHLRVGNQPAAEKAFQKALSLEPGYGSALNGLGMLYFAQKNYQLAETNLLLAARTAPAAHYGLAQLYLLQGDFENAEKWARSAIDSGENDELLRQILRAAQEKSVSEDLRLKLQP